MKLLKGCSAALMIMLVIVACKPKDTSDVAVKKETLKKLKDEEIKLGDSIKKLEDEIAILDPSTAVKPKLVGITSLQTQNFIHGIDMQGRIDADNISWVSPRNQGGLVKGVYVKQGDYVKQGQL